VDVKHHVELLPGARPKRFPGRRFGPIQEEEIRKELERWLTEGIIEPCDGPWASPLVVARKKDGKIRVCTDFRFVNSCMRKDSYPLPRIDDHLDRLGGAKHYTTIDLRWAYNSVRSRLNIARSQDLSTGTDAGSIAACRLGCAEHPQPSPD
jgi:hypothetical protein